MKDVRFIEPLQKPEDEETPDAGPAEAGGTEPEEGPIDIIEPIEGAKLPDIDDIPDIGEIEEPTLF